MTPSPVPPTTPAPQTLEAQLWCMHIAGPDDVHPAPDFWTALAWAAELNTALAKKAAAENWAADENYPWTQATVQRWRWSDAEHAAGLAKELAERAAHDERRRAIASTAPGRLDREAMATPKVLEINQKKLAEIDKRWEDYTEIEQDGVSFLLRMAGIALTPQNRLHGIAAELLEALRGVVEIAGRKTDEFDRAFAAIAAVEAPLALTPPSRPTGETGGDDWKDDPSADERWNAGLDFGLTQLCAWLDIDTSDVVWDAATETVDGDVQAVIGNILRKKFGDDFDFKTVVPVDAALASPPAKSRETEGANEARRANLNEAFWLDAKAEIAELSSRIRQLEEGIRPFAAILANGEPVGPIPRGLLDSKLTRADLRRATALLATAPATDAGSGAGVPDLSDPVSLVLYAVEAKQRTETPAMGSMAVASLYHAVGLTYGAAGFPEAVRAANRETLDRLLALVAPYQDRVRKAALAASPPQPGTVAGGWQRILTAKRNDTLVLLGWYDRPTDDPDSRWVAIAGWYEASPADRCWYSVLDERIEPTHWMPLPTAPARGVGG